MPTEKPHKPERLDVHDPYPVDPTDQPDAMAERRTNSAPFYAGLDADLAARSAQPTHITRTRAIDEGLEVTVDDGHGTTVAVTHPSPGRLAIGLEVDGRIVVAEFPSGTATHIIGALSAVAGLGVSNLGPIVGSR